MRNKLLLTGILCLTVWSVHAAPAAQNSWEPLHQNAKKHFIKLLKIDTSVANPDEISAARYIYKQFNKQHIDWDIFSPVKGRANLLARIK